jgi:hypothetical protein
MRSIIKYLNESLSIITFPKVEWNDVKHQLLIGNEISTTRNSCGIKKKVFRVGDIYETQWGMKIIITKVKHFNNPKKIPTWNKMNKTMIKSIMYGIKMCGIDNLQWVHLKKK